MLGRRRRVAAVGVVVGALVAITGGIVVAVALQTQTIVVTSSPYQAPVGSTYTVTATGGPSGNPVTFRVTPATCSITGNVVRFTHVGLCIIRALQEGNRNYRPAPTATQTIDVVKAP